MKKTKLNPKHLYAIFAFLLSAVVAFCGVQIRQEYSSRRKDIDTFAELAEWVEIKEPDEPKEATELRNGEDADGESNAPALTVRHNIPLLVSRNSDCIGWLSIENTAVDYPVMHTPDRPQKYLRRNFYQQYSDSGVPFLDYRCTLGSDNLIIFGHNMRNGTMFSTLKDYLNEGRLASDPTILLETEDGVHEFTIFAVACVDKLKELYGEEAHNAIIDSIAKEKCKDISISANGGRYDSSLDFGEGMEPEVSRTFYDSFSQRYFESTIEKVIQAEYHLNRNFMFAGVISLNDFYEFLELEKTELGDAVGWSNCNGDIYWIDFNHHRLTLDDGMEIYVIDMVFEPTAEWMEDL